MQLRRHGGGPDSCDSCDSREVARPLLCPQVEVEAAAQPLGLLRNVGFPGCGGQFSCHKGMKRAVRSGWVRTVRHAWEHCWAGAATTRLRLHGKVTLSCFTPSVQAYQYTSITSVTLLDCFTIPAVMVLSVFVFR